MTKHAQHGQKVTAADTPSGTIAWLDPARFESWTRATETCTRAYQAWHEEVLRFTSGRLERDGEFGRKLAACQDWKEAATLQQEWAAIMAQDYFEESQRLLRMASKLGAEMMESPSAKDGPRPLAQAAE